MSAAPAHTRTGGGFDIRSVYAAKKPIVESPRVSHPAVEAMFDPERDDKLAVSVPVPARPFRVFHCRSFADSIH